VSGPVGRLCDEVEGTFQPAPRLLPAPYDPLPGRFEKRLFFFVCSRPPPQLTQDSRLPATLQITLPFFFFVNLVRPDPAY
jgi:hypothetical protein